MAQEKNTKQKPPKEKDSQQSEKTVAENTKKEKPAKVENAKESKAVADKEATPKAEKPEKAPKGEKAPKAEKSEKAEKPEKAEKAEKPEKAPKGEKTEQPKQEKSAKSSDDKKADEKKRKRPGHLHRRPQSKRHVANLKLVNKDKQYPLEEAIKLLKSSTNAKFDESVNLVMKLGVDPRKAEQLLRGSVSLPKGTGKTVKVIAFAEGQMAEAAKKAGADVVGSKDLADKIQNESWLDFDIVIAHPSMMKYVGKLGKILGPQGKMPSPKSGTVADDVAKAVQEFKAGKIEYRTDSFGNVHVPVGKKSFPEASLIANVEAFVEHVKHARPPTVRGDYIQKICLSTTMGVGVEIENK